MSSIRLFAVAAAVAILLWTGRPATQGLAYREPPWQAFLAAAGADRRQAEAALKEIASGWRDGYAGMIVDVARFLPSPRPRSVDNEVAAAIDDTFGAPRTGAAVREGAAGPRPLAPGAEVRQRLTGFLERQTGKRHGDDLRAWRRWIWSLPYIPHPDYAVFKAELYARIDPGFRSFFPAGVRTRIRLDEIDWGGVGVNGIPPLRSPGKIPAGEARWLRDGHVVFGVVVNGEARAYPKRILAWHEMATDRLGGVDLTIVYCTLCGTVIPYASDAGDRRFTFGTSGLLYRSNKLMFDEETYSLWSSLEGVPVVGPLVEAGVRLRMYAVVTTTWGEWKRDHPSTTVLSLETGHQRDYSEGAAYREYFASDRLMFEVPSTDARLKNKAEVVVLRSEFIGGGAPPVAIAVDRLRRQPVLAFEAGGRGFVVITTKGGANLLYERGPYTFEPGVVDGRIRDRSGRNWTPTADSLLSETGEKLPRVPAHRAFWFGWIAQYPETLLVR